MTDAATVGREFPADQARLSGRRSAGEAPRWRAGTVGSRGMVTVEIALGSLLASAAAVLLAWALTVVVLFARCNDLAAGVARQEARGDQAAVAGILKAKPDGAQVRVERRGQQITVSVSLQARPWATWLPSVPVSAQATIIQEPA